MKVLCIDASGCMLISENEIYTASEGLRNIGVPNYYIHEVDHPAPYYAADRFVPLSEIDETQLVNQKEMAI